MDGPEHEQRVAFEPRCRAAAIPVTEQVVWESLADAEGCTSIVEELECPIQAIRLRRYGIAAPGVDQADPTA